MIRLGVLSDLDRAIDLLKDSRDGAGFNDPEGLTGFTFPFLTEYAGKLFLRHLERAYCGVYAPEGRAEGLLLASSYEHPFGPVIISKETVWWIDPKHRGSAAVRMLDHYEAWAKSQGAHFVGMAGMGDDPVVAKLYERRGYRVAEKHFLKQV